MSVLSARFALVTALRSVESVFFSLCWCNPNAVHVDSRLHCSDTATPIVARRAANGEEEKSSEEGEEGEAGEEAPVSLTSRSSTSYSS